MTPPRRKKWTEAEEKTLIDKYGEMVSDGTLAKMKTREKKFKPIAMYVNSVHHSRDPGAYPWQWTWKDVSTKVQNMRHQYLLVKQKIKKQQTEVSGVGSSVGDEYDWVEGLAHWSNFLRYKEVFGDVSVGCNGGNDSGAVMNEDCDNGSGGREMDMVEFGEMGNTGDGDFGGIGGGENGMFGVGFEYKGKDGEEGYDGNDFAKEDGYAYEEADANGVNSRKRKKALKGLEKKMWRFIGKQVAQLGEMEGRFEQRELEREQERQRRESLRMEREQERERKLEELEKEREERDRKKAKLRRERLRELEAMEKETEERERKRREERLCEEREWEERMNRRRSEWKKRINDMLSQHQAEMNQMQTRILHEQQNLTSQLLGIVSQWAGHPTGLSDHTTASNHYLSQMMQNLHHVNGMVHDTRVEADNQDDQFIVDG